MRKISSLLMMALLAIGMGLTSCDEQLDNAVTPVVAEVTSIEVDLSKIDEKYLDTEKTKLQLTVGDEVTLSFTILPEEMASTEVELTAADATILSIDGLKVKALKEGETKVTAKAGDKTAECTVTVKDGYLKWDDGQKKLVATEIPAEVTTVENSSTEVEWAAGTYVVDGEVTISAQITITGDVNLIIKDGAKLTVNNYIYGGKKNLSIYGQANQTGQLVVSCSDASAFFTISILEVHSCQVKSTSSAGNSGGFTSIGTFNVYGGSVDGENTGTQGFGIRLANNGSMNIYGGEVKAVGKGTNYGINSGSGSTVTVYGGKLWAENADNKALYDLSITLTKGDGFTGKIYTSGDGSSWTEYTQADTPGTKYVRVGY